MSPIGAAEIEVRLESKEGPKLRAKTAQNINAKESKQRPKIGLDQNQSNPQSISKTYKQLSKTIITPQDPSKTHQNFLKKTQTDKVFHQKSQWATLYLLIRGTIRWVLKNRLHLQAFIFAKTPS